MSLGMDKAKVRYDGKAIIYKSDGTGRDTYITRNNGGLMSQQMLKDMECKEKKPDFVRIRLGSSYGNRKSLPTLGEKFVHYHSDGTGRDSYIGWNNGGRTNVYNKQSNTEINFRTTLRTYTKTPSQATFFSSTSYSTQPAFDFTNTNFYLNPKQVQEKNELHKRQIESAKRLSRPKTAVGPYQRPIFSTVNSRYSYYNPIQAQKTVC
ncbi:hypothetical protein ABPG74_012906 [Tetrahymena malaccensis]